MSGNQDSLSYLKYMVGGLKEKEEKKENTPSDVVDEVVEPKVEEVEPKVEAVGPKVEEVEKPKVEEVKPKVEEEKPKVEEVKPKVEEEKPKVEEVKEETKVSEKKAAKPVRAKKPQKHLTMPLPTDLHRRLNIIKYEYPGETMATLGLKAIEEFVARKELEIAKREKESPE